MYTVNVSGRTVEEIQKNYQKAVESKVRDMIALAQEYGITKLVKKDLCPGAVYLETNGKEPVTKKGRTTTQVEHMRVYILLSEKTGFSYKHYLQPFDPVYIRKNKGDRIPFDKVSSEAFFLPLFLLHDDEVNEKMTVYGFNLVLMGQVICAEGKTSNQLPIVFQNNPVKIGIRKLGEDKELIALYNPQLKEIEDKAGNCTYTAEWREI